MSRRCDNCGKKQNVHINKQVYCVNCGDKVQPQLQSQPRHTNAAPPKQSTAAVETQPKTSQKPNLLDLSSFANKTAPTKQAYKPSQSIHGVRKPPATRTAKANPQPPLPPKLRINRTSERQQRAKATTAHPQVSKFPKEPVHSAKRYAPPKLQPAQPMSPHLSYEINPLLTQTSYNVNTQSNTYVEEGNKLNQLSFTERFRQTFSYITKGRRLATVAAISLTVLVLAGYITYLNVPSIAVRIAASRAGIDAQLPSYRPPGFSYSGPVSYSPGQLTIRFNSQQDNSYLALTQRQTDWDPPTLLENYVLPNSQHYRTYNQNGLTIYIYGGNNAAWINSGMFYTIEGESLLGEEQILRMAASL